MMALRLRCSVRTKLAPTYPESAITKPFPFNAYYDEDEAPEVDGKTYKLEVAGLVENKKSWTLDELYALPEVSQITRHICVEGWSAIGSWQGTPLSEFLKRVGADTRAKYVWFKCAEGYTNTIDMPTALHPQTQMTFKFANQILPRAYGYPDEDPHAHQTGIQESEIRGGDGSHQHRQRRLLGRQGLQLVQRAVGVAATNGVVVAGPSPTIRRTASVSLAPSQCTCFPKWVTKDPAGMGTLAFGSKSGPLPTHHVPDSTVMKRSFG